MSRIHVSRLLPLLLLLAVLPQAGLAQDVFRKTLPAGNGAVVVDVDLGDVEIRTHTGRDVRVEAVREVDGSWGRIAPKSILSHFVVEARQAEGGVRVEGRYRRDDAGRMIVQAGEMSRLRARFVLHVPGGTAVVIRTGAGAIRVGDRQGDVRAQTGSGAITVGNVEGSVTAQSASGAITVGDVTGDAHLETASGDVRSGRVGGRRSGGR